MNKQRSAAIILLASFVVILAGFMLAPQDLYLQENTLDDRVRIVEDNQTRFNATLVLTSLGAVGMAVGYLVLTLHLQGSENAGLAVLSAAAMLIGSFVIATFILQGIFDPRSYLETAIVGSTMQSLSIVVFAWLSIAAQLLYGLVFLRGEFPKWLAYVTLGAAALVLLVVVFVGEPAAAELFFLMPLLVGIVLYQRA